MRVDDVARIELGTLVRPPRETGTASYRVEPVLGYVVRTRDGVLLLDTGLGEADEETEDWYRPRRVTIESALRTVGLTDVAPSGWSVVFESLMPSTGRKALIDHGWTSSPHPRA